MALRASTGLQVKEVEKLLRTGNPPWKGDLSRYLHEERRTFPRDLVLSLDAFFAERLSEFTAGSLVEAFLRSRNTPSSGQPVPAAAPATTADPPPPRRSRRYRVGRTTALAVAGAVLAFALTWVAYPRDLVSGSVRCSSGAPVVGVFFAIDGLPGTNWGRTRPDLLHRGRTVFNAEVPRGLSHAIHVGCGGSPGAWAAEAWSESTRDISAQYVCDDTPEHLAKAPYLGTCIRD